MDYKPEWRNQNATRNYPFEDAAILYSTDGRLNLIPDWLVDAAIYPLIGQAPFSLGRVEVEETTARLSLFDSDQQLIADGIANRSSGRPIALYSPDGQLAGSLVVGPDANHSLFSAGDGDYQFGPGRADLVASCVMDMSSLSSFFGFRVGTDQQVSGELLFVGEDGIQITAEDGQEPQPDGTIRTVKRVRFHAIGDPQFLARSCEDISRRPLRFIREVVFQYGDYTHVCAPQRGGILLLAGSPSGSDTALQVVTRPGGVTLRLRGKSL